MSTIACQSSPLGHPSLRAPIVRATGASSLCLFPEKEEHKQSQDDLQSVSSQHNWSLSALVSAVDRSSVAKHNLCLLPTIVENY